MDEIINQDTNLIDEYFISFEDDSFLRLDSDGKPLRTKKISQAKSMPTKEHASQLAKSLNLRKIDYTICLIIDIDFQHFAD
jgi:hypothetical protein